MSSAIANLQEISKDNHIYNHISENNKNLTMLAFYRLSVLNIFFDETGFDSYHKVTVRDHICVPKFKCS